MVRSLLGTAHVSSLQYEKLEIRVLTLKWREEPIIISIQRHPANERSHRSKTSYPSQYEVFPMYLAMGKLVSSMSFCSLSCSQESAMELTGKSKSLNHSLNHQEWGDRLLKEVYTRIRLSTKYLSVNPVCVCDNTIVRPPHRAYSQLTASYVLVYYTHLILPLASNKCRRCRDLSQESTSPQYIRKVKILQGSNLHTKFIYPYLLRRH